MIVVDINSAVLIIITAEFRDWNKKMWYNVIIVTLIFQTNTDQTEIRKVTLYKNDDIVSHFLFHSLNSAVMMIKTALNDGHSLESSL